MSLEVEVFREELRRANESYERVDPEGEEFIPTLVRALSDDELDWLLDAVQTEGLHRGRMSWWWE